MLSVELSRKTGRRTSQVVAAVLASVLLASAAVDAGWLADVAYKVFDSKDATAHARADARTWVQVVAVLVALIVARLAWSTFDALVLTLVVLAANGVWELAHRTQAAVDAVAPAALAPVGDGQARFLLPVSKLKTSTFTAKTNDDVLLIVLVPVKDLDGDVARTDARTYQVTLRSDLTTDAPKKSLPVDFSPGSGGVPELAALTRDLDVASSVSVQPQP